MSTGARQESPKRVRILRWVLPFVPLALLAWGIFVWAFPRATASAPRAFVADLNGIPRPDVVFVGPDGVEVRPDPRGIVVFPSDWAGKSVSVRDADWREVTTIAVSHPSAALQRILIAERQKSR